MLVQRLISMLMVAWSIPCIHFPIHAQQDTVRTEITDSIVFRVESHPVLLYAKRSKLPYTVSVISGEKINQLAEPIIEPLLNAVPGLRMQSGTLNTNRISIRGIGYREPFATTGIKIYLDDIPLTNGAGEASIEDIHPNYLSEIEILRGPSSALWGAGLGGMILLRTKEPEDDFWQSEVQYGAYDRLQVDQQLSLRYGVKDQWETMLHYQYLNDDGFRENNTYRKHSATWMQHWRNARGWSVKSFLHAIALKAFIPSSITLSAYQQEPFSAAPTWAMVRGNEDYTKWITGITLGYTSKKDLIYSGTVFGTLFSSDEVRPFNVLDEKNNAYGTRHRVALRVHRTGHISAGLEYYRERYESATYETLPGGERGMNLSEDQDYRSYLHAFCQSEWNVLKDGKIYAGLSSAWSRLSNEDVATDVPVSVFPTVGLHYTITSGIAASGSLSRGYTALSLSDVLASDGTIQSDIVPETGWNKELSIHIDPHVTASLKLTGYSMHVRNTIITRRIVNDQFEKYNGGETLHRGIEIEASLSGRNKRWLWTGAYTFNDHDFSEFNDGGVDYSGKKLPGVPAHRLFQQLNVLLLTELSFTLSYHWVSEVFLNDANTVRGPGYHLMNSTAAYSFSAGEKWKCTISAHLHNMWDVNYAPMFQINAPGAMPRYYYPGKPRSLYVRVGFRRDIGE